MGTFKCKSRWRINPITKATTAGTWANTQCEYTQHWCNQCASTVHYFVLNKCSIDHSIAAAYTSPCQPTRWGKQSNWDSTTQVPLLIRAPSLPQSHGLRLGGEDGFFEMVDLFDTLTELAGLPPPPDRNDGNSAAAAMAAAPGPSVPAGLKRAAYSQYPRCVNLLNETTIATNKTPHLTFFNDHNPCTTGKLGQRTSFGWMGYTVRVYEYRFTIWLVWDGRIQQADWSKVAGRELYVYNTTQGHGLSFDAEAENVVSLPEHAHTVRTLHSQLHAAWASWAPRVKHVHN
eukprot:COSAG02_NODE_1032_length_15073_cov_6.097970_10_plen_288_part_00